MQSAVSAEYCAGYFGLNVVKSDVKWSTEMWLLYVFLSVVFNVMFTQFYKIDTKSAKDSGSLTVLLQLMAGVLALFACPFFEFSFPKDWRIYALLALACVFYAISDRVNTTVRTGIEASAYSIIQQLSTVFMIVAGLLFFREPFIPKKIVGACLIIISNVMIFYKRGEQKVNKYLFMGIAANIAYSAALFIDVNLSTRFNLAFYVSMTLLLPAVFLVTAERIGPRAIVNEFREGNRKSIIATCISWVGFLVFTLSAYQAGEVTVVAPLCSLTVIGSVIAGYLFLGERNDLIKKLLAAVIIVFSVFLIKG